MQCPVACEGLNGRMSIRLGRRSREIPVVSGANGLAWGKGAEFGGEFTGRSSMRAMAGVQPGVFRLSSAFGLAEPDKSDRPQLPYQPLTSVIECVDDVKSLHYNSIVDRTRRPAGWNSSEKMRDVGEQYRLGVVVDHILTHGWPRRLPASHAHLERMRKPDERMGHGAHWHQTNGVPSVA